MNDVIYTKLDEPELRKRCAEVWPDTWFVESTYLGEGICSAMQHGNDIYLNYWYVGKEPQFRACYKEIKRGMKRRPEAAAYIMGLRDDFND